MNKFNDIAINLINVSKKYTIHHEKPTLVEKLINGKTEEFCALRNINLKIKKGERMGIIGPNGSGKTTLLKLISGISSPTRGKILSSGNIVSLIDLGAGFHPDLTGYQNIFLNGMLLGMRKDAIERNLNNIMNYAGIGKYIDVPIYTYSTGMLLRLGFAVAVHSQPDIVILDENISIGDSNFSEKIYQSIQKLIRESKTIIVSSHNLEFIKNICNKVILMSNGEIKKFGTPLQVTRYYLNHI